MTADDRTASASCASTQPFTRFAADVLAHLRAALVVSLAVFVHRLPLPVTYLAGRARRSSFVLVASRPPGWRGAPLALLVLAGRRLRGRSTGSGSRERFFWLLVAAGLGLVAVGEFAYIRDAFDGTAELPLQHRLQGRLPGVVPARDRRGRGALCAPASGCAAGASRLAGRVAVVASLLLAFPVAASYSRTDGFSRTADARRDGAGCERAPGDAAAIGWLRRSVDGAPSSSRRRGRLQPRRATRASRRSPASRR